MDNNKLRIGIALENKNYNRIKNLLSEKYPDDFYYYQVKYDLYLENIESKIDLLLMDIEFCKNSVYRKDCFNNKIPLIIYIDHKNPDDLVTAINYHPYDIWINETTSKERIFNSIGKIINKISLDDEFEQFREIVEHLPISVVISDHTGKIEYVNPQFEKVCGYNSEELIDKNPSVLKSVDHDENFYKNMWETIYAGNIW